MQDPATTSEADATFSRAMAFHVAGQLDAARSEYLQVVSADPKHAYATHCLGLIAHTQKDTSNATRLLRSAVALRPSEAVFHHSLGQALRAEGDLPAAVNSLRIAASLRPQFAGAWDALASTYDLLERTQEAKTARERAIMLRQDTAARLFHKGLALAAEQNLEEACNAFRESISANPEDKRAQIQLSGILESLGKDRDARIGQLHYARLSQHQRQFDVQQLLAECLRDGGSQQGAADAAKTAQPRVASLLDRAYEHFRNGQTEVTERLCREVLESQPDNRDALHFLGLDALRRGDTKAAIQQLRKCIASAPENVAAHSHLATALLANRRFVDCVASANRALALRKQYVPALYVRATAYEELGRHADALREFDAALAIEPLHVQAAVGRSRVLLHCGQGGEARLACEEVLSRAPESADAHEAQIQILIHLGRDTEAAAACDRALAAFADHASVILATAMYLLKLGRYQQAWPLYELRRELFPSTTVLPRHMQWTGETVAGKSMLLVGEQGFGDQIQFSRYATVLKTAGARHITLLCDVRLCELFRGIPGIDAVFARSDEAWKQLTHDYWIPLLSCPLYCQTTVETIPGPQPYLSAPANRVQRWSERLPHHQLKVGLVWKGNPNHAGDHHRSMQSISVLAPLWMTENPKIAFISLQKGAGGDEAMQPPVDQPLLHLGSDLEDFADTAAVLEQLDLLITVDTSIAHLAGAMGIPCWVMLASQHSEWRWLRDPDSCPWYPKGLRLFRQGTPGDWQPVVAAVTEGLRGLVSRRAVSPLAR